MKKSTVLTFLTTAALLFVFIKTPEVLLLIPVIAGAFIVCLFILFTINKFYAILFNERSWFD